MMDKKMIDALNQQINREFYSGYLYLAMANYFAQRNLSGFENWLRKQAEEEKQHALKIFDYLLSMGEKPKLTAIDEPKTNWTNPLVIFEAALDHEKKITKHIYDLVSLAKKTNDYTTESFLKWYIDEQVEEEKTTGEFVNKLKMIEGNDAALLMLDATIEKT